MWVHYPQDVTTFSIDDQFLLGEKGENESAMFVGAGEESCAAGGSEGQVVSAQFRVDSDVF